VPTQTAYHSAKFAVKGFTDSLCQELKDTSISVSCVLPGGVKTNIVRSSRYVPNDNESPTKEEVVNTFETFARLTPDQAAAEILRGVARDRRRILVGDDARLFAALVRLLPVRYMDVMAWLQAHEERRRRRNGS